LNVGDQVEETMVAAMLNQEREVVHDVSSAPFEQVMTLAEFQKSYVQWVVQQYDGNLSAVARRLGISRSKVYRIIKQVAESGDTVT